MAAMSPKKTYTAIYERDPEADAWIVHIDGVEGCQTYGRSLRQAQSRIREALALWLDREAEDLVLRDQLPKDLEALAQRAQQARADAERAGTKAQEQAARAAKALTERGLSRRDAAELLGISHQRVQQLLEAS
jgi:predicted RNase H-like HicB family nuclease